jgi:lathosterol oxidase
MLDRLIGLLGSLKTMPLAEAALWVTAGNYIIFIAALTAGHLLVYLFRRRIVFEVAPPLRTGEVLLALVCVFANCIVTFSGVVLWRKGFLRFRDGAGWQTVADFAILFLVMDAMMYALHQVAHHPWFYGWMHRMHHLYEHPRPLTLFVMNPLETLAFGALWITVILVYPPTWLGMLLFLSANVTFGMIGHLGVEIYPSWWGRIPLLGWLSTSTFHNRHHRDRDHNLGFYTVIWDRLFRTLAPVDGRK